MTKTMIFYCGASVGTFEGDIEVDGDNVGAIVGIGVISGYVGGSDNGVYPSSHM